MTAAAAVARLLSVRGIRHVWCFPGGTISPLLDAIDREGIRVLVARNEAGAGHAAQGAYRVSGGVQIVLTTSGPGVTNAVTPIADAYYDSDAVVFLTGQVGTGMMRGNQPVRQRGFQETPTEEIVRPITKAVFVSMSPGTLARNVDRALRISLLGRPGPVVVDCPMDVQRGEAGEAYPLAEGGGQTISWRPHAEIGWRALLNAKCPLIIAGRGALDAHALVRTLVQTTGWALVASMPAVGVIPTDWKQYRGIVGHTGHRAANEAVRDADCLLVLGARLDVRQTGTLVDDWARDKTVIRVDVDPQELSYSRVRLDIPCRTTVKEWLRWIAK